MQRLAWRCLCWMALLVFSFLPPPPGNLWEHHQWSTSHRLKPWQQTDHFAFLQIGSSIGEVFYHADQFRHESQISICLTGFSNILNFQMFQLFISYKFFEPTARAMGSQYKSHWLFHTSAERRDKEKKLTFVTLFSEKHVDSNIKGRRVRKESFESLCKKKKDGKTM